MSEFIEVPDTMRKPRGTGGYARVLAPRVQALVDGKTIFVPGPFSPGGVTQTLKARGLRGVTRKHTLDGVEGTLVWAEPR